MGKQTTKNKNKEDLSIKVYRVVKSFPEIQFEDDEYPDNINSVSEESISQEKNTKTQCPKCQKILNNHSNFERHLQAHLKHRKKCNICQTRLLAENFKTHYNKCKKNPKYSKRVQELREEELEKEKEKEKIKKLKQENRIKKKFELHNKENAKTPISKKPPNGNLITNYFKVLDKTIKKPI